MKSIVIIPVFKKNKIVNRIIFLFFLIAAAESSAQQLSPFVISPSGGFYNNASGMLSFTTGEMSAVETFIAPSAMLTQGFQQYWDLGTYITEHPDLHFSFGIYPNPTNGYFDLLTETEKEEHIVVEILDLLGRVVLRSEFDQYSNINIRSFDLTASTPGMYIIAMTITERHMRAANRFVSKLQVIR